MAQFTRNLALCIVLQTFYSDAARILAIYPTPSISHQIVFRPITEELVNRGHELVVLTTDPIYKKGEGPKNLTEIDLHDVSYESWRASLSSAKFYEGDIEFQMEIFINAIFEVLDKQLQVKEVKDLIKGKGKFDLLLSEAGFRIMMVFSHIYKVPVIQISSLGVMSLLYEDFGAPSHPLLYPDYMSKKIYNRTMWEKFQTIFGIFSMYAMLYKFGEVEDKTLKKHYGANLPPFEELQIDKAMLFVNLNPIWEGIRPVPPNVIHMGGLAQKSNKPLPEDLQSYLNSSKNGVIYISFGTNVNPSFLPSDKIQIIVNAFSKLPYNVLWKWNTDELPGRSNNIKISKWFPQSDLLKHPKIKLFITQGGLQSTDEAILAGVPCVVIPLIADQWYNAEKYVHHGIGVKLELSAITDESFTSAIKTVINDKSYRENIIRLRTQMSDQPQTPLQRAVWWIEYVLRHGGAKHLRPPAANMAWAEYYELKLVAVALAAVFLMIVVTLVVLHFLFMIILNWYRNQASKKSKVN